jgi:EmrB/QacA subfamily drug resistance transporter
MATQDTSAAQVTGTSATDDPNYPRRWWILGVLGLAQLMVVLDVTIVNIALPHAQASLAFSNTDRQWIVTGYSLAFGSLLLLGGRIADNFGRKRVFLIGIVGFAAASAFGGAAQNFDMLLAARVLQGAFGALLAPATLSLLTTTFTDPQERTKATGIYGGIAGAGASVGLLLGGFLTQYLDWRWVMYVNVVLAAFALAGGGTLLKNVPSTHRPKLDLVGTVLAAAGLFCLVFGFSNASMSTGSSGWTKPGTLGTLIGGVVLLIVFVLAEQWVANPLLPLRVVLDRNRGGAYMSMFLAAIGMFGVFLFLTYYLEETLQWSAVKTGVAFLPLTLILVVVAAVGNTILLTRVSPRIAVPIGLLMSGVAMALLTRIGLHSHYASDVLPTLLLLGIGLGLVFAPAFTLGTLGVDRDDAGVASASINVAQQIGGSIGTSLLNTIAATAATSYATAHAASITSTAAKQLVQASALIHSYHVVFWVAAGVFAVAAVLAALVLRSGVAIPRGESAAPAVHA